MNKTRIIKFRMTETEADWLEAYAAEKDTTMSLIIRNLLYHLKKKTIKLSKLINL